MTTSEQENTPQGSSGIPERKETGIPERKETGIPERKETGIAGPSREMSITDATASGVDGAGRENNNEKYRDEDEHFSPVRDVIRKTELLGWDVWPAHHKRWKIPVDPEEDPDNPEEE
jgi:hypothetical protein